MAAEGLDLALEASRLHALLDGLAPYAVMRPTKLTPSRIKAVLAGISTRCKPACLVLRVELATGRLAWTRGAGRAGARWRPPEPG
jgi:hypothetical protein